MPTRDQFDEDKFLTVYGTIPQNNNYPTYLWYEVRCTIPTCPIDNSQWRLSGVCQHLRHLRKIGRDKDIMRAAAVRNSRYYNMVLAPLVQYDETTSLEPRKADRYINFGVTFPKEPFLERMAPNVDERTWGDLGFFRPAGPGGTYELVKMVAEDVVFTRPYDLTTNAVRAIGLNYLAEKFFNGLTCTSPNHGWRGKTVLELSRKVSAGNHKNINALNEVAYVLLKNQCHDCEANEGFGLADF